MTHIHTATRLRPVTAVAGIIIMLSVAVAPLMLSALARPSANDVVAAFAEAGLESGEPEPMTLRVFGAAPHLATEAVTFPIWSLKGCFCEVDPIGRVLRFDEAKALETTLAYYQGLAASSVVYDDWLLSAEQGSPMFLVILPGGLTAEQAQAYDVVLQEFVR